MDKKLSTDPRSVRARRAFQDALKILLKKKSFSRITVTDIASQAGFSRHTFYNHFETKEELLNSFIDIILEEFFDNIGPWDKLSLDSEADFKVGIQFFKAWKDRRDLIEILRLVDLDLLLISRMKTFFRNYYYQYGNEEITGLGPEMAQYVINMNAYSWAGILRQWFDDNMEYPPELIGHFLNHFLGIKPMNTAIQTLDPRFRT